METNSKVSEVTNEQRRAMLKALVAIPNFLSVESLGGIVYAQDLDELERKMHDKATEKSVFKVIHQMLKNQKEK